MEIVTGPNRSGEDLTGTEWFLLASLGAVGYNYWRMRLHMKRIGEPMPSLPQIGAWLNLEA